MSSSYVANSAGSEEVTTSIATWSITGPSGLSQNDLIILAVQTDSSHTVTSGPSGFTEIGYQLEADSDSALRVWYKFAGASESGPYSITFSPARRGRSFYAAYRGINLSNPLDVAAVFSAPTTNTAVTAGPITPVTNGAMLVALLGYDPSQASNTISWTAPANERLDATTSTYSHVSLADYLQTSAAQISIAGTLNITDQVITALVALRPNTTIVSLPQATETDTAQAISVVSRTVKSLPVATETGTSQAIGRKKLRAVAQAVETDYAVPLAGDTAITFAHGQSMSRSGLVDPPVTQVTVAALVKAGGTPQNWSDIASFGWTVPGGWNLFEGADSLIFGVIDSVNGQINTSAPTIPRDGLYHRLVGSYDGAQVSLFVDGELSSTRSMTNPPAALYSGSAFWFASMATLATMTIDELAIFKGAWDPAMAAEDWRVVTTGGPLAITLSSQPSEAHATSTGLVPNVSAGGSKTIPAPAATSTSTPLTHAFSNSVKVVEVEAPATSTSTSVNPASVVSSGLGIPIPSPALATAGADIPNQFIGSRITITQTYSIPIRSRPVYAKLTPDRTW